VEEKVLRAIPWTLLAYGVDRAIGFATTVVLARLLVPNDFGLLTLGLLVISFMNLFGGLGLGQTLVVRQDLDRRGQGCLLTLLIATGVVAGAVMAALAPLAARVFEAPRLTNVLYVFSGVVAFSGLNWFYTMLVQRELEFRRRFIAVSTQVIVNSAVAIPLAANGVGVWSLVAGVVAGSAAYGAVLIVISPYRVRPTFDKQIAGDLIATGRGFLLQGITTFAQLNADYVAVGRILDTHRLGFYSTAYRLGELPQLAVADPVSKVTFPGFSRMREREEDVPSAFLTALRVVALVACPIGVIMSGAAEPFVRLLLGQKWLPAIGPVAVFGIWAAVRVLAVMAESFLNAVGLAGRVGKISLLLLIPHVVTLVVAARYGGITWVAWAMLAHMTFYVVLVSLVAAQTGGVALQRQWEAARSIVLACIAAWLASRLTAGELPGPVSTTLAGAIATGLAAYLGVLLLLDPGLPGSALRNLGRALGRPPVEARS
jgi:PST family polysaccharide transporter